MMKMARGNTIPILILMVVSATTKDLYRADTGRTSNKVLVKYEGTLEEVNAYGSSLGLEFKTGVFKDWYVFTIPQTDPLLPRDVPDLFLDLRKEQKRDNKVKFIQQEKYVPRKRRALSIYDAKWPDQWHLQPAHTPNMNVYKAWEKGFTGSGVTVAVVDDGIDVEHPDLIANYNASLSYDYSTDIPDASHKDPEYDGHGTNCAGLVGAANNTDCVIGIAYEINMAAVRLLGEEMTASMEAQSLTHKFQYIDIYSNSWGPDDDGMFMDNLYEVVQEALELTIKEGRKGKGAIHTWASGNGGNVDNCNADAYSSSVYTISIGAVDKSGSQTFYSEPCTSILAVTFSGDSYFPNITTTGPNGTCVDDFLGTSAATPMATGIIALTLQANPDLTWRDIQHMIVEFSNFSALNHTSERHGVYEFYTNGAGKEVSIYTGFGLMDAQAMVDNAPTWSTVPPRLSCSSGDLYVDRISEEQIELVYNVTNCYIKYLEHVQVSIFYNSSFRGDVEFYLLSPMFTESNIFPTRPYDSYSYPTYFTFMSVHTWGEDPHGEWTLTMFPVYENTEMHLYEWRLDMFGTATDPFAGIPAAGTFGSPCSNTSSCTSVVDGGCLKDNSEMCDNICVPCKNGYHLNGEYCEKECPPLLAVDGSYIVLSYESEVTIATYTCYTEFGYMPIIGNETRMCGSDGVWTGTEPACDLIDCGPLDDPVNANLSYYDNTTYGSYAIYTCDEGYAIKSGDEGRMCSLDGEWSGTEPTCKPDCGPLESPENGTVVFNDTIPGSEVTYSCDEGYVLSEGDANGTCGSNGKWSSVQPLCLIDCGPLQSPENGTVSFTDTLEDSEAMYTCDEGYTVMEGDTNRTCGPDGQWSSVDPVCIIDCGKLETPENGNVSFTDTFQGSMAMYTCKEGYVLSVGDVNRTCGPNGQWSSVQPECLIDCGPLTSPTNGNVSFTDTLQGFLAMYSCEEGYTFSEGNANRTCEPDGTWSSVQPKCSIDCGPLQNPENGYVSFTGTFQFSMATYACEEGYIISEGASKRTCGPDGRWSSVPPICLPDCGRLASPENGNVSFTDTFQGSEAMYTCKEGYILTDGNTKRTCESDGQWSSGQPKCLIDCGTLSEPDNSMLSLTSTTDGSNATYTCTTGFAVSSGNLLRTCGSDGIWTGTEPVCDIDCGPLENPDYGNVALTATTRGSEAVYTCKTGYSFSTGNSTRTCNADGNWTGTKPTCVSDGPTEATEDSARVIGIVVGSVLAGTIIIVIVIICLVFHYKRHTKSSYSTHL